MSVFVQHVLDWLGPTVGRYVLAALVLVLGLVWLRSAQRLRQQVEQAEVVVRAGKAMDEAGENAPTGKGELLQRLREGGL